MSLATCSSLSVTHPSANPAEQGILPSVGVLPLARSLQYTGLRSLCFTLTGSTFCTLHV